MTPIYCSFYTPAYSAEAQELLLTLGEFNLPADVRSMPDAGSWVKNCGMKAGYVREMMREHPDRPVVWVDADGRVKSYPLLFDSLTCDFAAHWRHGVELLSGTLFFSGTEAATDLADDWIAECRRHPDVWDQKCLEAVVRQMPGLSCSRLPPQYTCVFDDPKMGPAVIEHLQRSRVYK